jgi:ribosomal small subunit protein bTHX
MGKGDKKSKKGKRFMGSYGNSRKKSAIKARIKRNISSKPVVAAVTAVVEEKPKAKRVVKKKEVAE